MFAHILLPGVELGVSVRASVYRDSLESFREQAVKAADSGVASASDVLMSALVDIVLSGTVKHDWTAVMEDLLTRDGRPVAYSDEYGKLLHKFHAQYLQTTIHAIHTRWWVERAQRGACAIEQELVKVVASKLQADGLYYDFDVSETTLRHRMKAELALSGAMAAELLVSSGRASDTQARSLAAALTDVKKLPPLGYMITEGLRLSALRLLGHEEQFPVGIAEHIELAEVGLEFGWCDFSIASKVDAYMGTAKRTGRDRPVHSPLVACHVASMRETLDSAEQERVDRRLASYAAFLNANPYSIPAFQMRDVQVPFGPGLTPVEAVAAISIVERFS